MRLLLALTVMLSICGPITPAEAGWKLDRATKIAELVWDDPCVDQMTIKWGDTSDPQDTGLNNLFKARAAGMALRDTCTVVLDGQERQPWPVFCTVVLHEAGHLAGRGHSRHGIMRAERTFVGHEGGGWDGADRRCRDRGRAFLDRHGLAYQAG